MRSRVISIVVTVLFIVAAVWLIREGREHVPSPDQIRWIFAFPLILAAGAYTLFQGLLLRDILRPEGINLSTAEHFGCSAVTTLWNYIFPFSGFAFRGLYLKRVHALEYARFIGSTSALFIVEIAVFSGLGLLSIAILGFSFLQTGYVTVSVLGGAFLGSLLISVLRIRVPTFLGGIGQKISTVLGAVRDLLGRPSILLATVGWTAAIFLAYASMYYFSGQLIGMELPLLATGVFSALTDLALLFRVAPAAAGTYDASVMYVATEFGLNLTQGLLLAFLVRLSQLAIAFTVGVWFHFALSRRMASTAEGDLK